MAGEPLYTLLLLGLGLTTFSMNSPDIPEVKKIIRSTTTEHARFVARKVMSFDSERQVMHFLREETRKIIPEAFRGIRLWHEGTKAVESVEER